MKLWERRELGAAVSSQGANSWISVTDWSTGISRARQTHPGPLVAYAAASGEQLWSASPQGDNVVCSMSKHFGGASVIGVVGGDGCRTLFGVDVATGQRLWSVTHGRSQDYSVRTETGAIALVDFGSPSRPDEPSVCFASDDGSPLPATSAACAAATEPKPRLVRADGSPADVDSYFELARHGTVRIGWLSSESESQLFAFDTTSGKEIWQRSRLNGETVFADGRGFVRVLPDGDLLNLTRVDGRTWATSAELGSVQGSGFVAHVGDVSMFLRPEPNWHNPWLTGYRIP
ncbi:hypothetical protein N802_12680 [Knoellia sinensis KCTC 19936]|uniref:Pyrrolo-quinoline quinone repeat domain-containing protein n=1 Tax=Knoellia sinensis KCTC 19936 TaxID=1385520 RepID=A0A0A0JC87_9MICO|nr:hypothetical protein N802_12680 [Knoellia sinensis KCTC 19936]